PAMTLSSILTMLAHVSAPFLSTFLVIHLPASIAVNIGGSRLASSVMVSTCSVCLLSGLIWFAPVDAQLLGREYY
ncbi:hypothetical protein EDD17DRAFT_1647865, partial [Pisolithus thermaeus]